MLSCWEESEEFQLSESAKVKSDVALDKVEFTVGLTLIIWSIVMAMSAIPGYGPTVFLIFFLPPIGAYLIIRSVTNILRAIRDGE